VTTITGKRSKGAHQGRDDLDLATAQAIHAYQVVIELPAAADLRRFARLDVQ
jgi:hypothetical protein